MGAEHTEDGPGTWRNTMPRTLKAVLWDGVAVRILSNDVVSADMYQEIPFRPDSALHPS